LVEGKARIVNEDKSQEATGEIAKTAAEVLKNDTVATRPARGG
jgi:hypothetical protein